MSSRLQECIENREQYMMQLCSMRDDVLARKIDLIHAQLHLAHQEKNIDAVELLTEWLQQVLAARLKKDVENIPDTPNEMELEMEQFELMDELSDERKKVLETKVVNEIDPVEEEPENNQSEKPDDEQLSLF